ncbi:YmL10 [Trapelia coarctata]|nr:YmL10 [Trapelia coarctata]
MPPRLSLAFRPLLSSTAASTCLPRFLLPYLLPQSHRSASILSSLSDNPLAYKKKIRRGRGPSSGKGKTSGRGHKGQKQHGKVPRGFNGGQTPIEVVHGIRGFKNVFSVDLTLLNLSTLQTWIDQSRIDPTRPITLKELSDSNCVGKIRDGVKLLATGADSLRQPVNIIVSRASASAIAAVEKAGGSVLTRFYTPFAIQRILRGQTDPVNSLRSERVAAGLEDEGIVEVEEVGGRIVEAVEEVEAAKATRAEVPIPSLVPTLALSPPSTRFQHRLPDPTSRKDFEYYRDPAHRGYLSHLVTEGQTPSLFFKIPKTGKVSTTKRVTAKTTVGENRIW